MRLRHGPGTQHGGIDGAYVLADRGTWLSFKNCADLAVLVEGRHPPLQPVRRDGEPERHPHVKQAEARKFVEWWFRPPARRPSPRTRSPRASNSSSRTPESKASGRALPTGATRAAGRRRDSRRRGSVDRSLVRRKPQTGGSSRDAGDGLPSAIAPAASFREQGKASRAHLDRGAVAAPAASSAAARACSDGTGGVAGGERRPAPRRIEADEPAPASGRDAAGVEHLGMDAAPTSTPARAGSRSAPPGSRPGRTQVVVGPCQHLSPASAQVDTARLHRCRNRASSWNRCSLTCGLRPPPSPDAHRR